jgi:hypothetical protein
MFVGLGLRVGSSFLLDPTSNIRAMATWSAGESERASRLAGVEARLPHNRNFLGGEINVARQLVAGNY